MKEYRVYASQVVFYSKVVKANSPEEAEQLAWEDDTGNDWKEFDYGDWQLEETTQEI